MLLRPFLLLLCGLSYDAARASISMSANDQFCINTLNQFQASLVNRIENLDSLELVFSPSNYQPSISFIVHYHFCTRHKILNSSEIFCDDIEKWANDVNAGKKPTKDFSKTYAYKFLWNASPMNLFIRPDLLATLSLFTFRTHIFTTHIILDKLCEDIVDPTHEASSNDALDICRKPTSILLLLESLTSDLNSFHLHKQSFFTGGIKSDGMEQGHPLYYFDPLQHKDDVCVLSQVDTYTKNRWILAVAIFLTQLLIPIVIPFAARIFYGHIKYRITEHSPASTHYFFGFIVTTALLGLFALVSNIYLIASEELNDISDSNISDIRLYYIIGAVIMLVFNPLFGLINIWYNNARTQGGCCFRLGCCRCCCCRCNSWNNFFTVFSISALVFTANIIAFNGIYIFMGLIAAPIETGSLLFLYLAVFFLFTMFVALMHKGYKIATKRFGNVFAPRPPPPRFQNYQLGQPPGDGFIYVKLADPENPQAPNDHADDEQDLSVHNQFKKMIRKRKLKNCCYRCVLTLDASIVVVSAFLVLVDLFLYMTFYYRMAINLEPYTSSAGFLSSFSILVPALFTLTAGILEKRLINFLSGFDTIENHTENKSKTDSTGDGTRKSNEKVNTVTPIVSASPNYGSINNSDKGPQ